MKWKEEVMNQRNGKDDPKLAPVIPQLQNSLLDGLRQFVCFPAEFRISEPAGSADLGAADLEAGGGLPNREQGAAPGPAASDDVLAEVATCLWYLKTKFFKREWANEDGSDPDPRVRRALGRMSKALDAIKEAGFEIQDPTNKRYPQGGENLMKPIQFQPTDGLTFDKVIETATPIIYRDGQLIQRGEVFVAVPPSPVTSTEAGTVGDNAPTVVPSSEPLEAQSTSAGAAAENAVVAAVPSTTAEAGNNAASVDAAATPAATPGGDQPDALDATTK